MKIKSMIGSFVGMLVLLGLAASASAQLIFLDNYETTPAGVIAGSPPPSPYIISGTNAVSTVTVFAGIAQSSPNSLRSIDTDGALIGFTRPFGTNLDNGKLSFDFRFDPTDFGTGGGFGFQLRAPQLNNFSIPAPIFDVSFSANLSGPTTNVSFRTASGSGFFFFPSFPVESFQHIEIGWENAQLGASGGDYYITWNGITNSFTPYNIPFTNITSFATGSASQGGFDTSVSYIDNLTLSVPEPSVAALGLISGFAVLFRRRMR